VSEIKNIFTVCVLYKIISSAYVVSCYKVEVSLKSTKVRRMIKGKVFVVFHIRLCRN